MSESLKISGKKVALPEKSVAWTFNLRPGGWVIAQSPDGRGGTIRKRIALTDVRGRVSASIGGFYWHGEVVARERAGHASAASESDLIAQFPGKVRKILVREGQPVGEGDPLVLVEAMKMEFVIKSPYSGVVKKILVKDMQQLSPGDRLVEVEATLVT